MAVYTVHRFMPFEAGDEEGAAERVVFVKEAFAWPAFFFTGFWAMWKRMWLPGLALLAAQVALDSGLAMLGLDAFLRGGVLFAYLVLVGLFANDLRRAWLKRQGFELVDVVSGASPEAATQRYFDRAR